MKYGLIDAMQKKTCQKSPHRSSRSICDVVAAPSNVAITVAQPVFSLMSAKFKF